MRAPGRGKRRLTLSRREEVGALLLIGAAITIPLAGALLAISASERPDLSDLVPIRGPAQNYPLLNWSTLLREHPLAFDASSRFFVGAPVQALGYMVEGDRTLKEGEWVQDFVILPEAGNILHPAHRFGDQMIAVHLGPDEQIRFSSRELVWVWGTFGASAGEPVGSKPLYTLERARAQAAKSEEIRQYFK